MFHEAGMSPQAPVAVRKRDRQGLGGFEKSGKVNEMTEMIATCFS